MKAYCVGLLMVVLSVVSVAADEPLNFDVMGGPQTTGVVDAQPVLSFDVFRGDGAAQRASVTEAGRVSPLAFEVFRCDAVSVSKPRPRVLVYSAPEGQTCPPCERLKTDARWLDLELDYQPAPDWVRSFPTLHWQDSQGQWRKAEGWQGVERFLRLFDRTQQEPQPGPQRTERSGYPVRPATSWWSGGGQLRGQLVAHLLQGQHAGRFTRQYLETLSTAELQSLHSDDHEGRVHWAMMPGGSQLGLSSKRMVYECRNGRCGWFAR